MRDPFLGSEGVGEAGLCLGTYINLPDLLPTWRILQEGQTMSQRG